MWVRNSSRGTDVTSGLSRRRYLRRLHRRGNDGVNIWMDEDAAKSASAEIDLLLEEYRALRAEINQRLSGRMSLPAGLARVLRNRSGTAHRSAAQLLACLGPRPRTRRVQYHGPHRVRAARVHASAHPQRRAEADRHGRAVREAVGSNVLRKTRAPAAVLPAECIQPRTQSHPAQRAGFRYQFTHHTTPSEINFPRPVTRWVLDRHE
jgi:hypothetical protein